MSRTKGAMVLPGLFAVVVAATFSGPTAAQAVGDTLRLETALELAREKNPALQSRALMAEAALERTRPAGALPDPMLTLGLVNWAWADLSPSEPMSMNSIQLQQRFPWPGKLGYSEERAELLAEAEQLFVDDSRLLLEARVKSAYFRTAYMDRALAVLAATRDLLVAFEEVAAAAYSVGDGLQQDVLQAQVAVARMTEEITAMEQRRVAMAARLNALLGRGATEAVGNLELPDLFDGLPAVDSLYTLATANRPALAAAESRVRAADAGYRAAGRAIYPDFTVSLAYGQRPDYKDLGTLMVGISIPLWAGSRQKPVRREMEAIQAAEEAGAMEMANETFARLAELRAEAQQASNLAVLYETSVLPQARAAVESSLSAYRVGDVDFLTLVANQMTVNQYEVQRVELIAEYHVAVGEIEALIGGETGGVR